MSRKHHPKAEKGAEPPRSSILHWRLLPKGSENASRKLELRANRLLKPFAHGRPEGRVRKAPPSFQRPTGKR